MINLFFLQRYVTHRIRLFAHPFARRLNGGISHEQVDHLVRDTLSQLAPPDSVNQIPSNLRLVLRHDCQ